MTMTVSNGKG